MVSGLENNNLIERDLAVLWHPCTQMKDHEELPLVAIRKGLGAWLEDYQGKRYLDAISSWWVNLFGHGNPKIREAVHQQLDQLEHVLLAGFTHAPAVNLAEQLVAITPSGLDRCFFADNGSSAVEVALKMSFHYWRNRGRLRKSRFICLENSYHGETLGALSVSQIPLYRSTYAPLLLSTLKAPSPDCYWREAGQTWEEYSKSQFLSMRNLLERHADEVCAVIVEPLVQCAGGMRMYDPIYLKLLREACDEYGVHLIIDEIAVGFGRTGTLFATEQATISPDFMCLSKGLTGGFLPLSAVLTTEKVYRTFYDDYATMKAFLHSHSYTGNPLACSAALATLAIFAEQPVLANNEKLAVCMGKAAQVFCEHQHVAEVRQTGMILAIEMVKDKVTKAPYPVQERRGLTVYRHALERGVLLRPVGNVIYFMPPYIVTEEEIQLMVEVALEGIHLTTKN